VRTFGIFIIGKNAKVTAGKSDGRRVVNIKCFLK